MNSINDIYGRTFRTLRVSLLNRCNFGCTYCTEGTTPNLKINSHETPALEFSELVYIIQKLHNELNLKTIRLTGGEPLLYSQLPELVYALNKMGIPEIKITTNGFLLERLAPILKTSGLQTVNVSLDALDEDVFFLVSRRMHLQKVLDGIEAARIAGMDVRINSVIMKGVNHTQLIPLLEYAFERGIVIRFLELMKMGHLHNHSDSYFFSQHEMLEKISMKYGISRLPRRTGSTANYWKCDNEQVFGIIANETEPFCADCDRLRLDSRGNIYGCLSSNEPISISRVNDSEILRQQLRKALSQKQDVKFKGSELSMMEIGG